MDVQEDGSGDSPRVKTCRACEKAMGQKNGFWVCMDLTGCAMGGQQQGKAE